jgi:hypothetical protein
MPNVLNGLVMGSQRSYRRLPSIAYDEEAPTDAAVRYHVKDVY